MHIVDLHTSPCAVAIVGFSNEDITVTEGQEFEVCVAVTQPSQMFTMRLAFSLEVTLIPITSGRCAHMVAILCCV